MLVVLIVGLLMNAIALPLAARRILFLYRVISSGQPAPDRIEGVTGRLGAAAKRQLVEVFGQRKMLKWSVPGTAHFFVMWAFFILATVYLEAYGSLLKLLFTGGDGALDWAIPVVGHWAVLGFLQDFIAVMALFGLATFWWIRLRNAPKDLGRKSRFFGSHLGPAYLTLFMIFNVIWTMFLFRGASAALGNLPYKSGAFVSIGVGKLLDGLGHGALEALEGIGLLLHIGVMLVFLIFVLNSKHLHIFLAPLNVMFGREPVALGAAKPMMSGGKALTLDDLEDLDEDAKLGVGAAEDFSWKGVLDMATCTECGRCQSQCPAWNTEKPLSPKLLMMALRDHTMAKAPYLLADEGQRDGLLEGNETLAREVERPLVGDTGDDWFYMPDNGSAVIDPDVLWSCVTCGACVNQCPVDIEHVDHIIDMRRYQVLVESNFPSELNGLFKGMENKGNPWNMSPTARMDWAKDLPFDVKVVGEDVEDLDEVEWLFWVGCAGAYEDRAKKTTRAVAELLDMAGVSFAVLGNGETCTGDSARRAGNEFVFQGLAAQNIETFKEYKVKKVVSTCAHCFNTLKNEYTDLGIELEVVHHTQLLNRLVREKKLAPVATNGGADKRSITYHDPCYIGRHNGVYSPPRELLDVIPDVELTEMPRNSERSFCCGAGGARMWMEETIGTRINETRTMEAVETGADQIAVGCPFCRVMLSDGLTSAQSKGEAREEVEVIDVAQMLLASVKGESRPAKKPAAASESQAGGAAAGATATATIEREQTDSGTDSDEATKAEPEAGDVTQTEETVTDTEDVGPAAKASGGGSLFDVGDDDSGSGSGSGSGSDSDSDSDSGEGEPKVEATATASEDKGGLGGGSLFDVGDDEEVQAEPAEETADKDSSAASSPAASEKPEAKTSGESSSDDGLGGGSLFDIADDDSTEEPAEPRTEDTGDNVDRSQDDADGDVEPEAKKSESSDEGFGGGSLFDIGDDDSADASTDEATTEPKTEDTGDNVDRSQDDADTDVQPDEADSAEPESSSTDQAEPAPAPASSGTAITPGTEIPEGGSLFDIEEPAEEQVSRAAPTTESTETAEEPEGTEDAAGDSTTDGQVDRSEDDADTDVQPDEPDRSDSSEPEPPATDQAEPAPAPASSGTAITPGTEIPEGGSLFDIEVPAEEQVSQAAPTAEATEEPEEPEGTEDAAGDSTTDGQVDRSEDDADTDVQPDEDTSGGTSGVTSGGDTEADEAPVTSLRDIKAKFSGEQSESETEQQTPDEAEDEAGTETVAEESEESEESDESDESEEEKPKPAPSGDTHQPRTDAEIGEGGSLFDL